MWLQIHVKQLQLSCVQRRHIIKYVAESHPDNMWTSCNSVESRADRFTNIGAHLEEISRVSEQTAPRQGKTLRLSVCGL